MKEILKHKKIITTVLLVVVIVFLTAFSFAYFSGMVKNDNPMKVKTETGIVSLLFRDYDEDGNNVESNDFISLGSISKKFIIENTGTAATSISVDFVDFVNTYTEGSLTYRIEMSPNEEGPYEVVQSERLMPVSATPTKVLMAQELPVDLESKYYYNLVITYNNLEIDQTQDLEAMFHASFNPDQPLRYKHYTLNIDVDGGTIGQELSQFLKNGETLELKDPTRVGYNFAGWQINGVGSLVGSDKIFTMGISDCTLKAVWEPLKFNICLSLDGGTHELSECFQMEYDSTIKLKDPVRRGYRFIGWSVTGGYYNEETHEFTMNSLEDVTITASWEVIEHSYTIIYRQEELDGTYSEISRVTGKLGYGETYIPSIPEDKVGFTTPTVETITMSEEDIEVTYDYKRKTYTLTINPNGGVYDGNTEETVMESIKYEQEIEIADPTKEGYIFVEWLVSSGASFDSSTKTFKMGAGNATLIARYRVGTRPYKVEYRLPKLDGGYDVVRTLEGTLNYGETFSPEVTEYPGFTGPTVQSITIGDEESYEIIYEYTRNQYNFAIDENGGSYGGETAQNNIYYDQSISIDSISRDGYSLTGWTVIIDGEEQPNVLDKDINYFNMPAGNTTLKANWSINSYKYVVKHYIMNVNGGYDNPVEVEMGPVNFGTNIYESDIVAHDYGDGFEINRETELPFTITSDESKNVIVYRYVRKKFKISIDANGGTYQGTVPQGGIFFEQEYLLEEAKKEGYDFGSWLSDHGEISYNASTGKYTFKMTDPKDTVITADWVPIDRSYTVYHKKQNVTGSAYNILANTFFGTGKMDEVIYPDYHTDYNGFSVNKTGFDRTRDRLSLKLGYNETNNTLTYNYDRDFIAVTVDLQGGSSTVTSFPSGLYYGQTLSLGSLANGKAGYTGKWVSEITSNGSLTTTDLTSNSYKMNYTVADITSGRISIKLKAVWTPIIYEVSLDKKGGDSNIGTSKFAYHYTINKYYTDSSLSTEISNITIPQKLGYTFNGYYAIINGVETQYINASGGFVNNIYNLAVTQLYAKWTAGVYHITLYNNDADKTKGTRDVYYRYTVNAYYSTNNNGSLSGSISSITVPSKTGYNFKGYYTGSNGSGTQYITESGTFTGDRYNVVGDVTLYPKWEVKTYTVRVKHYLDDLNGNPVYTAEYDVEYNNIAFNTTKSVNAKTIVGFTPKSGNSSKSVTVTEDPATHEILLYYSRNSYALNINKNGGVYRGSASSYSRVTNNSSYKFVFDSGSKTYASTNHTKNSASEISFYANGTTNANICYDISSEQNYDKATFYKGSTVLGTVSGTTSGCFDLGTITSSTLIKVNYSKDVSISSGRDSVIFWLDETDNYNIPTTLKYQQTYTLPQPAKTGYSFTSWSKTSGTSSSLSGNNVTMGTDSGGLSVYANYSQKSYLVSFNANGGSVSPSSKYFTFGSSYSSLPTPTKSGYNFTGWHYTLNSSDEDDVMGSRLVNPVPSMTVYAGWSIKNYTVNVAASGSGTLSSGSVSVPYNGTATFTANPNSGYEVSRVDCPSGYSSSYTRNADGSFTVTIKNVASENNNVTCTVIFDVKKIVITFDSNGGYFDDWAIETAEYYNYSYADYDYMEYISTNGEYPWTLFQVYRNRYSFDGWYTSPTGGTWIKNHTHTKLVYDYSHTLYAHWTYTG